MKLVSALLRENGNNKQENGDSKNMGRGIPSQGTYASLWSVSFLCVLILSAQTVYGVGLSEMQEIALGKRQIIKRYITNLEKSEKDITRAKGGYYPSLDLRYTLNSLDESSTTEAEENSVATGIVSWNLFSGFEDKYTLASAKLLREVETSRLRSIRQDIQLNVALRYLTVFERQANLQVTQDAVVTLEKIYRDGQSRLEVGLIDRNELLKFKVDLDNAEITMKAARASLDRSVLLLAREIDARLEFGELTFTEFTTIPALGNQEESETRMLASRSEIKVLQGLLDAASMQVKAEYGGYYPQIDIEGSYRKYDDDFVNGNGDNDAEELRAQLVVSMNLFNGYTDKADVAKAKLEVRGLQYDLAELKDTLITELKNLYIDFEVSLDNVSVAEQNIRLAKESLRITQLKYDEGLQRESDLLDAITNLSRARFNYVSVIRTVFDNYFRINRMVESY